MSALTGIFATLPGIENIPPDGIQRWLKTRLSEHAIENFLANRILYPETVPLTQEEKLIDQAILQEYIFRNPARFYNPLSHRLIIPSEMIARFQPLENVMVIFCSLLGITAITPVFIAEESTLTPEGSIIVPTVPITEQKTTLLIDGKPQTIENGKFYHFAVTNQRVKIKLGAENEILVSGGKLGITVDLRQKGKG
jgi:hypothetical protein